MPAATSRDAANRLPATFTVREAVAKGLARRTLYRLRDEGAIFEISRGVYRRADAPETEHIDLIAAAKRAPRAIVCLVSALAIHELTDEMPPAIEMALPAGLYRPKVGYPRVKFSQFNLETFDLGKELFEVAPHEPVAVYNAERAIADAMRLRNLVTDTVALRALRIYLSRRSANPGELARVAGLLGDARPLIRAIQVVQS